MSRSLTAARALFQSWPNAESGARPRNRRLFPRGFVSTRLRDSFADALGRWLLCLAVGVAAVEPLGWLFASWQRPGGAASGAPVALGVAALFLWSASAPLAHAAPRSPRFALLLLFASLGVRLAGQWLAINILSAGMLALDLYALGRLCRLHERERAVDPLMLAALFCFALPLEAVVQRSLGFLLQQLSALLACGLIDLGLRVDCEGARIRLGDVDLLVDLPCSGARLLTQIGALFCALHAVTLPRFGASRSRAKVLASGACYALGLAIIGNTVRIVVLALGLAQGAPVMSEPLHSVVGLVVLCCSSWLLVRRTLARDDEPAALLPLPTRDAPPADQPARRVPLLGGGLAALALALGIGAVRGAPLDVSALVAAPRLPAQLAGSALESLPLSALENRYFEAYGGAAARGRYGDRALLLVRTTSPLRHLHAPDDCYAGAGYEVEFVSTDHAGRAAVYRMRDADGVELRVRVSFLGSGGQVATSVSEAVWYWLTAGASSWTMVQAIERWHAPASNWRAAVERALDLGPPREIAQAARPLATPTI
ncbi:MAG: exosortase T [Pseudomonadota bacterium]